MEVLTVVGFVLVGFVISSIAGQKEKRKKSSELAQAFMDGWNQGYDDGVKISNQRARSWVFNQNKESNVD